MYCSELTVARLLTFPLLNEDNLNKDNFMQQFCVEILKDIARLLLGLFFENSASFPLTEPHSDLFTGLTRFHVMHGNRIRLRQQLERDRLELERQREEKASMVKREMAVSQQTPSMDVPASGVATNPNQVTIEVPTNVLEVRKHGAWQEWVSGNGCG